MKRIISLILVITVFISTVNISFAAEVEHGDITSYSVLSASDIVKIDSNIEKPKVNSVAEQIYREPVTSCITDKNSLLSIIEKDTIIDAVPNVVLSSESTTYSSTDFIFNANLLTSFNTVTAPVAGNGANEPKFSYNSFLEENISDYSGELTLNFEDLVLDGRNGLDLRIGRTYQTVASSVGNMSIMVLPNENGYLKNKLVNNYSTYQLDRYNLGMGWSFSFPSVQVETEYIPQEVADTYYYDKETELYYHSGNGEVYQVEFTDDTTDSNLKGYYNKDIQFNKDDLTYSNGQITSYYSLTLADKTKQYFAEDGRLLGIIDRFGNTIKFEHNLHNITNRVPEGNFRFDNEMWTPSVASDGTYDAYPVSNQNIGSNDGYVMYFRRHNENDNSYIVSQPIQIKPQTYYNFGMRFKSQYGDNIKVEIIGYRDKAERTNNRYIYIQ